MICKSSLNNRLTAHSRRRGGPAALLLAVLAAMLCLGAEDAIDRPALIRLGERQAVPASTYHLDGVIYLPAEPLLDQLGLKVVWNAAGRRLTVRCQDHLASITLFSNKALVNGRLIDMPAAPRLLAGQIHLPEKFFRTVLPELTGQPVELSDLRPIAPPEIRPRLYADRAAGRHHLLSLRKLALDAGHGAHDPGARSPQGINEKDINLAIVLQLADKLRRETDLEVILTRSNDTFIPLPERPRLANLQAADLFISVHANGAYRRAATGFEVYFLSLTSSDRQAAALAMLENGGHSLALPGEEAADDLHLILGDLLRTENLAASERLALAMQARLDLAMNLENRGVKQAPFYVLAGAQMPAVLIEVGFVTNPEEALLLVKPEVQQRIVEALYNAILYYDALNAASEN